MNGLFFWQYNIHIFELILRAELDNRCSGPLRSAPMKDRHLRNIVIAFPSTRWRLRPRRPRRQHTYDVFSVIQLLEPVCSILTRICSFEPETVSAQQHNRRALRRCPIALPDMPSYFRFRFLSEHDPSASARFYVGKFVGWVKLTNRVHRDLVVARRQGSKLKVSGRVGGRAE